MARSFAYELFRDGNQRQAYIRAGYKGKLVDRLAYNLMQQSGVKQAVEWLVDAATAQDERSTEWIVRTLDSIRLACMRSLEVLDRHGKPSGASKMDSAGALRAVELIGKARGIFSQVVKHEHSGSVTHLLQAIAGTGKPALEDRAPIDVTPAVEEMGAELGASIDDVDADAT
jgi:hypothetical protein